MKTTNCPICFEIVQFDERSVGQFLSCPHCHNDFTTQTVSDPRVEPSERFPPIAILACVIGADALLMLVLAIFIGLKWASILTAVIVVGELSIWKRNALTAAIQKSRKRENQRFSNSPRMESQDITGGNIAFMGILAFGLGIILSIGVVLMSIYCFIVLAGLRETHPLPTLPDTIPQKVVFAFVQVWSSHQGANAATVDLPRPIAVGPKQTAKLYSNSAVELASFSVREVQVKSRGEEVFSKDYPLTPLPHSISGPIENHRVFPYCEVETVDLSSTLDSRMHEYIILDAEFEIRYAFAGNSLSFSEQFTDLHGSNQFYVVTPDEMDLLYEYSFARSLNLDEPKNIRIFWKLVQLTLFCFVVFAATRIWIRYKLKHL